MEAFHLLSRGGARFDKQKFKDQVELFDSAKKQSKVQKPPAETTVLPVGLDFFKYAQSHGPPPSKAKDPVQNLGSKGKPRADLMEYESDPNRSTEKPGKRKRDPSQLANATPHRIAATGARIPDPISSFDDLRERYGVPSLLLQNLQKIGYETPTAIQSQGIPILLESRDLAAISPTGTGKTLAYLLPIFTMLKSPNAAKDTSSMGLGPRALIVAPTRELAGQIHNECLKLAQGRKWRLILYSKSTGSTLAQKEVRDRVDIIISTPLRLVAALKEGTIELNNVRHLVLDEADRLLEKGFVEQTEEVVAACTHPDLRKAVLSATLPSGSEEVAKRMLADPVRVVVGLKDAASLHISQTLTYVGSESGKLLTLRQLLADAPPLPMLVFVQSKERATELHQELLYDNLTSDVLHSGMTAKQREESVARFRKGETWVMVCTDVMARGMDFGGVKGVVNFDFPQSVQSYIHRIGRTGRAGRTGKAVTYWTDEDAPYVKSIANIVHQSNTQQAAFANAVKTNLPETPGGDSIAAPSEPVPEWMLTLPKPSQMKRRQLMKHALQRKAIGVVAGRHVGKKEAIRKREMIAASKRRNNAASGASSVKSITEQGESWEGIS